VGVVEFCVVEGIEVVVVLLTLLVPPFLELVVGSARHGMEEEEEEVELDEGNLLVRRRKIREIFLLSSFSVFVCA